MSNRREIYPRIPKDPRIRIGEPWVIYNTSLRVYLEHFQHADLSGEIINPFFENIATFPELTVIDLMASTKAVEDLRHYNKNFTGIAVGLYQDEPLYVIKNAFGKLKGVTYVAGNLTKRDTWNKLSKRLNGKKAQLIMEHGFGGLGYVPTNVWYYRATLARLWEMADPQGLLLLMTPPKHTLERIGINMDQWLLQLQATGITYGYCPDKKFPQDPDASYGLLILVKNSDQQLPDILNKSDLPH